MSLLHLLNIVRTYRGAGKLSLLQRYLDNPYYNQKGMVVITFIHLRGYKVTENVSLTFQQCTCLLRCITTFLRRYRGVDKLSLLQRYHNQKCTLWQRCSNVYIHVHGLKVIGNVCLTLQQHY